MEWNITKRVRCIKNKHSFEIGCLLELWTMQRIVKWQQQNQLYLQKTPKQNKREQHGRDHNTTMKEVLQDIIAPCIP